ncbi:hypothetical protein ES706_04095 [subsurface metagenome]
MAQILKFKEFSLEKEEEIIENRVSNVIIEREDPYKKLGLFILKYAELKGSDGFSKNELLNDFGLIDDLCQEIIRNLTEGEFLATKIDNPEQYILSEGGKSAIIKGIISWKEVKDLTLYFSRFPKYFIPNFLIPFNNNKKLNSKKKINPFFKQILDNYSNANTIFGIPEQIKGVQDGGIEKISILDKKKIRLIVTPKYSDNNERNFIVKLKCFPWYWREIIDDSHPEINELLIDLKNFAPEHILKEVILSQFNQKDNNLDIKLVWDNTLNKWILNIIDINDDFIDDFIEIMRGFNYFYEKYLENPEQKIIIDYRDKNNRFWKFKIKIQMDFSPNNVKSFFLGLLSVRLVKEIKDIRNLKNTLKIIHDRFCKISDIIFPLPDIDGIKDYLWSSQNYEGAYLLMYEEDFKNGG